MSNRKQERKSKLFYTLLFFLALNIIVLSFIRWQHSTPYDKAAWLAGINDTYKPTTRRRMLRSIQNEVLQVGTTHAAIVDALGESDTDEYFQDYDFVYWISPDSSLSDSEWLVIELDENGKLVNTAILTD